MPAALENTPATPDYSLIGVNSRLAVERGLAEAEWYQCPVPRATMRTLLERRDGPALVNIGLWLGLLAVSALATWKLWGSAWAIAPYALYAVLYASGSDSRWHESGHGTAFKTDWLNSALYELSSFMVMRESVVWRWSHTRHHSDTIIVGRDPEIASPRPPNIPKLIGSFFNLGVYPAYFSSILRHAFGRIGAPERTFVPASEFGKVIFRARIYVAIYAAVIALSITQRSLFPLMMIGLVNFFGSWLLVVYGLTQHAGLAENVLDHRLNCRTVYMNPLHRFLYLNMNYHVEHHMFPLVPFHALPRLHEAVKEDCPVPYPSLWSAWREIIPSVWRQHRDPAFHVKRTLPDPKLREQENYFISNAAPDSEGWVAVCDPDALPCADVLRFDHGRKSYAVCRDAAGKLFAIDGICTHGNVHLSEGLVKGNMIECPKHNGRYFLADGSPARVPVCRGLATYPVDVRNGLVNINIAQPGGAGARETRTYSFRVVSNQCVATFIKELVLVPEKDEEIAFDPGDYLQLDIPAFGQISFRDFDICDPYRRVWEEQHVFDLVVSNAAPKRNNYSIASNLATEGTLRFNVRIATPPPGQACAPGAGSAYVFSLKPGDRVTAIGPFGDFHIKPTQREMIYIGGGAGMAPLRAHLSHLLETEGSQRRISFWYGARSRQELFYGDYFEQLAERHTNFSFHIALSSPLPEDSWTGLQGFVHDALREKYLATHGNPASAEYYLCGPPMMIKACTRMLADLGVPPQHIAYDEF